MSPLHVFQIEDSGLLRIGSANDAFELNRMAASSARRVLAISARAEEPDASRLKDAAQQLHSQNALLGIVPASDAKQWTWLQSRMGPALTAFVLAPEQQGFVIISNERQDQGEMFRSVDQPVWEYVLRTARTQASRIATLPPARSDDSIMHALPSLDSDLPALAPTGSSGPESWLHEHLSHIPLPALLGRVPAPVEVTALRAGFWQLHDDLDESHQCSQQIEGKGRDRNGDYWHAIMHRREPDYSNSKYWFRHVSRHPLFGSLARLAQTALIESGSSDADRWIKQLGVPNAWDSAAFVDLCQAAERQSTSPLAQAARRIQRAEQLLLLVHTFDACSKSA